jgi:hypothetical protein
VKKALLTSLLCSMLTPLPSLAQLYRNVQERELVQIRATAQHAACGKERWPVKTLTDSLGEKVAASSSTPAKVAELVTVSAPTRKQLLAAAARRFPQEQIVYRVSVLVIGDKREADSDFHIVLADPVQQSVTLIAEIPSGSCTAAKRAKFFNDERAQFATDFGKPAQGKLRKLAQPVAACVTGVGFFDFLHGQDGVAPNGFELHPVLSIVKGFCT